MFPYDTADIDMFPSSAQVQRLVGGDESAVIDVADLKAHCQYEHGYYGRHRVIKWLWQIVEEWDNEDRERLLKFVTSVSKPPLLGFEHLSPPFTVRFVEVDGAGAEESGFSLARLLGRGSGPEVGRLPTAATCFNVLKLPAYKKKDTLREKLLYAVRAGAGFDLS